MDDAMVRARAVGLTRTAVLFRPSRVAETTSDAFSRRPPLGDATRCLRSRHPRVPILSRATGRSRMRLLVASVALALVASASAQLVCARVEPSENANTSATTKCTPLVPALLPDDADPAEADALARCACAYARRACDLRDATCEIRGGCAPSPSENLACLVPLCELCDDVPVPEGAPRERLCRLCRREMDRGLVAARVDPLWSTWTYGWYSTWLVFLAVDAVVAASLAGEATRIQDTSHTSRRIPTSPPNTRCPKSVRTPPRDPRGRNPPIGRTNNPISSPRSPPPRGLRTRPLLRPRPRPNRRRHSCAPPPSSPPSCARRGHAPPVPRRRLRRVLRRRRPCRGSVTLRHASRLSV